jgi:DNA polymerase-3 subunit delta'
MTLLLHQETEKDLKRLISQSGHAVLIEGKAGAGKRSIANLLTSSLTGVEESKLTNYQYLLVIEPVKSSISIDEIRKAQNFLKLKTTGTSGIRRVIIVEQAELLTIEAQNAFLKILEEPPEDTAILILTCQKFKLLPTILSRVQTLQVRQINKELLSAYFKTQGYSDKTINAAYHASNAQIGLMSSVLGNESDSVLLDSLDEAKKMMTLSSYDRLLLIDSLAKQKEDIPGLINAFITVSQAGLSATISKDEAKRAIRWHKCLSLAVNAQRQLIANPNPKLLLTDLLLNL